jgi:cytochrome P450
MLNKKTPLYHYMNEPPKKAELVGRPPDTNMLPAFDPAYVEGAVKPFFLSTKYEGEPPLLPMIDLAFSKEAAVQPHIFGMLYDNWTPSMDEEGVTVFLRGYEKRGPNNERKRIYFSAVTPDLYDPMYSDKIKHFLDYLFDDQNEGKPLMHRYYQRLFDMYWDLHLGVTGKDIPPEVREIGTSFITVLGFWNPTMQVVYENYMRVRRLRPFLKEWIDKRIQDIIDRRVPNPEKTMVYYWIKNGELGENFRRKDMVFECFHNFLAFSQWGNTLYNIMARLEPTNGDPAVRSWFEKTMNDGPDESDKSTFTRLDRFVMELFRTISPNAGSGSTLTAMQQPFGTTHPGYSTIITPHSATSRDPLNWKNPNEFDPERYKQAPTSEQNDESKAKQVGLTQSPFSREDFQVKDGRHASITNSAFGAVYPHVDDEAYPLCDTAGYAPFGFGYRRCAGEFLTVGFIKDLIRKVWNNKLSFIRLNIDHLELLPVGPRTVVPDNIGFKRTR